MWCVMCVKCSTVMIAIIDKIHSNTVHLIFVLFYFLFSVWGISYTSNSNWTLTNYIKQKIEFLSFFIRTFFLNETIKRMLFVMFSYIFTLVSIRLLRHHPYPRYGTFSYYFIRIAWKKRGLPNWKYGYWNNK